MRLEWKSVDQAAYLGLEDADACQVVMTPDLSEPLPDRYAVRFSMKIQKAEQERVWLLYWQDPDNYLAFRIFGNALYPEKRVNGQSFWLGHTRFYPFKDGETYFVHLEYWKSRRKLRVFINHVFFNEFYEADTHPQIPAGKPGLAGGVNQRARSSSTWYDNYQIRGLGSELRLPVFGLQQTDPLWKGDEYDHALLWSPTESTIERWGCALVSAVMVLRTHGLSSLPGGQELTPRSLNGWLKQQKDGYIGLGHLNWRALSRLSWEVSRLYGTPKLEFQRVTPDQTRKTAWLHEQLQLGLPVILEQPGHFVVASGFSSNGETFIEDPYFARKNLTAYDNTYLSARLFTPSHTDLSSILVTTTPEVEVKFYTVEQEELFPESWLEQPIRDPMSGDPSGPPLKIYEFNKPANTTLTLEAHLPLTSSESVVIYAYQKDGKVSAYEWIVTGGDTPQRLTVQYEKEIYSQFQASPAHIHLTFSQLLTWLENEKLRSPLLLREILHWQDQLLAETTLTNTEALFRKARLLLLTSQRFGWIEASSTQQIIRIFQQIVRERFP